MQAPSLPMVMHCSSAVHTNAGSKTAQLP
jgi:hypothetical protein